MLTARRHAILKIIVDEYVSKAAPVASKNIADNYDFKVSPATIRNDIAYLEQEGYITHPYSSAGSIPTDKTYRYYVESISGNLELPLADRYAVYELSQNTNDKIEQRLKLAAAWLASFVHNMAVITSPTATHYRLKYLHLVSLADFVALLILVLHEAKVRRQILYFNTKIIQDDLTKLANKLSSIYSGMTSNEVLAVKAELSPEEEHISECVAEMIAAEDKLEYGELYLQGLRLMLSQPEFTHSPSILNILEVLEREDWLKNISCPELNKGELKIIIGEENPEVALQDLSLVISQYGSPNKASGIVGVLGPKRMDYTRAICSINCLSSLLSESVAEYT